MRDWINQWVLGLEMRERMLWSVVMRTIKSARLDKQVQRDDGPVKSSALDWRELECQRKLSKTGLCTNIQQFSIVRTSKWFKCVTKMPQYRPDPCNIAIRRIRVDSDCKVCASAANIHGDNPRWKRNHYLLPHLCKGNLPSVWMIPWGKSGAVMMGNGLRDSITLRGWQIK